MKKRKGLLKNILLRLIESTSKQIERIQLPHWHYNYEFLYEKCVKILFN